MYSSLLSIACGAVLGAWIRWFVGLKFNPTLQHFPLGTILVNLVGGFIIGYAIAFLHMRRSVPIISYLLLQAFVAH